MNKALQGRRKSSIGKSAVEHAAGGARPHRCGLPLSRRNRGGATHVHGGKKTGPCTFLPFDVASTSDTGINALEHAGTHAHGAQRAIGIGFHFVSKMHSLPET